MLIDYHTVPERLEEGEITISRYDGMEHLICVAERKRQDTDRDRVSRKCDDDFYGTPTFGDAVKLARFGWPQGEKMMAKFLPDYMTWFAEHTQRDRWRYDVEGEEVDVPRMLEGEMECWRQRHIESGKRRGKKYIHIVVNLSVSYEVAANEILQRGAVITGFTHAIELAGYRVKVDVVSGLRNLPFGQGDKFSVIVPVKDYSDRFDPSAMAFPLGHPAMFRRLIFGAEEMLPRHVREKFGFLDGRGYGYPSNDFTIALCPEAHINLYMADEITPTSLLSAAAAAGFHLTQDLQEVA